MSDYEPKNIPTLDDVIEENAAEDIDKVNPDTTEPDELPEEQPEAQSDEPDEAEHQSSGFGNVSEDIIDTGLKQDIDEDKHHYPDVAQVSVQVTYEEIYDKSSGLLKGESSEDTGASSDSSVSHDENIDDSESDTHSLDDRQPTEATHTLIDPIALDTIVEDVVKQLLPDLEQQLRFLIQQALEEKLPEEIIQRPEHNTDTETDTDIDAEINSEY